MPTERLWEFSKCRNIEKSQIDINYHDSASSSLSLGKSQKALGAGKGKRTLNPAVLCSWMYLGGTLSSVMSVLLLMRLGSYFLGGKAFVFQAELYVGLLMFIGYVLFDTQVQNSGQGIAYDRLYGM